MDVPPLIPVRWADDTSVAPRPFPSPEEVLPKEGRGVIAGYNEAKVSSAQRSILRSLKASAASVRP